MKPTVYTYHVLNTIMVIGFVLYVLKINEVFELFNQAPDIIFLVLAVGGSLAKRAVKTDGIVMDPILLTPTKWIFYGALILFVASTFLKSVRWSGESIVVWVVIGALIAALLTSFVVNPIPDEDSELIDDFHD